MNWEERVAHHLGKGSLYSKELAAVQSGCSVLQPTEVEELSGLILGKKVLHLQCHIGTDTLSLKHAGASEVVGLDFSGKALEAARKLAASCGVSQQTRWVEADVYRASEALSGETFDLVYCSVGTLCWLPDISSWAREVGKCVSPGGTFYIRDSHPMLQTLADDATPGYLDRPKDSMGARDLLLAYPYFEVETPMVFESETSYGADASMENRRTFEWNHSLGQIITALIQHGGMTVEFMHEHRTLDYQAFDFMERIEEAALGFGGWKLPKHLEDRCPLMFSLRARKLTPNSGLAP
jgi:SAM-dependent methyltransferase